MKAFVKRLQQPQVHLVGVPRGLVGIVFAGLLLLVPQAAQAASLYWVGGNGDSVNTNANDWNTTDPSACNDGAGNASAVPGTSDIAIFDADCDNNAVIDSNWSVAGIDLKTGYAGTVTQNTSITLTVGTSNYVQAAGTFTGGDSTIDLNGTFTLSGGTFTATSGTMDILGNLTISGGTFTHNSGTVKFNGSSTKTWDVNTSLTLNNFTVDQNHACQSLFIASGDTIIVAGAFIHEDGTISAGTIRVDGSMTVESEAGNDCGQPGTTTISFTATGDQTITVNGGSTSDININKSSGTVSVATGTSSDFGVNDFTLSSGGFTAPTGTLTIADDLTITGGTFTHNSGTVKFNGSSTKTWDVNTSLTLNNFTVDQNHSGQPLVIASGDTIIVAGTFIHEDGKIDTGTIRVDGSMTVESGAITGTGIISFTVTGDQTITANGGSTAGININKSSGTVSVATGTSSDFGINNFTLSSGGFTAPTGTLTIADDLTITGGTFTHNSGTVKFSNGSSTKTWDVNTSLTLNNFTVDQTGLPSSSLVIASGDTIIVAGTFIHEDGKINTGTIEAQGNVVIESAAEGDSATLSFTGTNNQTYTDNGGDESNGDITINKSSGTVTLASNADWNATNQDLTITDGTLDLASYTIATGVLTVSDGAVLQLQGGETVTTATTTLSSGSTVIYNGTGSYTTSLAAGNDYHHLTFNGSGGVWEPNGAVTVNGDLTITNGTLDLDGQNLTVTGTFSNNDTLRLQGGETTVSLTNDTNSGTIEYDGTSSYTGLKAGNTYNHLTFNGSGGSWTLNAALDVNNALTITAGSLIDSANAITVGGNWSNSASYTGTGTVTFDGSGDQTITTGGVGDANDFTNLTIANTGGTVSLSGNLDVDGAFSLSDGIFVAPTTMTVSGNWSFTGDTFTHNSGTVTLDGANQTLSGATTFNHLSKTVTSAATLTFPASTTTTVAGTLTLQGASGQLLSLRSSASGTQWSINPQGSRTLSYLDVKDSNNTNSSAIITADLNITDSGNNTNWTFNTAPSTTAISKITQATDGSGYVSFTTLVSDPDNDVTRLRVYYSEDDGANWYDPYLVSAAVSGGNVTVDNSATYQVSSIDTDGANIEVTITWNTQSSSNGNGAVKGRQSDLRLRLIPDDSTVNGTTQTSGTFTVDNQAPTGLANLSITATRSVLTAGYDAVAVSWSAAADEVFSHYELWYGRQKEDVTDRVRAAVEWDADNDSRLSLSTTRATTIASITPDGTYYLKLWAVDQFGNSSTLTVQQITIDGTAPVFGEVNDLTTTDVSPTILIPVSDTLGLGELRITVELVNTFLGVITGYTAVQTTTYPLSGTEQTVSFTPTVPFTPGQQYRLTLKVTDRAGNTAQQLIQISVLTDKEAAQIALDELAADTSPLAEIIEQLRGLLPESFLDLEQLERQSLLRRHKQAVQLQRWLEPLTTTLQSWWQAGQGKLHQTVLAVAATGQDWWQTVITNSQQLTKQGLRQAGSTAQAVEQTRDRWLAVLQLTSASLLDRLAEAAVRLAREVDTAIKLAVIVPTAEGLGYLADKTHDGLLALSLPRFDRAALRQAREPVGLQFTAAWHQLQQTKETAVGLLAAGQEIRVRQGLKNRQLIGRVVEGAWQPVQQLSRRVLLASRHFSEIVFDASTPTHITNLRITALSPTAATISWETNHLTRLAKVNYGTSISYGQEVIVAELTDRHQAVLTNLLPGTVYYFEVTNQNGDYVFDAYYSVTTPLEETELLPGPFIPQIALVLPVAPTQQDEEPATEGVSVYQLPDETAEVVTLVQPGEEYRALATEGVWLSILLLTGQEAWVRHEQVRLIDQVGPQGVSRSVLGE